MKAITKGIRVHRFRTLIGAMIHIEHLECGHNIWDVFEWFGKYSGDTSTFTSPHFTISIKNPRITTQTLDQSQLSLRKCASYSLPSNGLLKVNFNKNTIKKPCGNAGLNS
jgi:hypothetical protein